MHGLIELCVFQVKNNLPLWPYQWGLGKEYKYENRDPYLKRTAKRKATTGRTFDIADEDVAEA